MPSYPLVLVHGWGCAPSFWDTLAPHFSETPQHRINLGFVGDAEMECPEGVYITHSLGTMWALRHARGNIKALISINGFCTFRPFAPKKVLAAMQARLQDDPEGQMRDFWAACGLTHKPDLSSLNREKLARGLDWLAKWDETEALHSLSAPVLSVMAGDDRILPLEAMQKMWQDFTVCASEDGGHALPQTKAAGCAGAIKDFLG